GAGSTALARKLQPAAVTLDLGLNDMDGFVLLDLLRNEPDTASIPVYVISGGEMADDALELGAVEVIEKPADRERLAEAFGAIAKLKPRKKPAKGASKKQSGSAKQLAGRRILLVDDDIRNIYS